MKYIIMLSFIFLGCSRFSEDTETNRNYKYRIVEVDSCEYVIFWDGRPDMAAVHKGNCKYCEERKR